MSKSKYPKYLEPEQLGVNGYKLGYNSENDLCEWFEDESDPDGEWPLIIRRNDNDIRKAAREFHEKVWYNRHQCWLQDIDNGKEILTKEHVPILETAKKVAKRLERKYGKKNLGWDDFDWGIIQGKLSALAWVLGSEWEDSLDT